MNIKLTFFFTICFLNLFSQNKNELIKCINGEISFAETYCHFTHEKAPKINGLKDLIVHIDSTNLANEFISFEVDFERKEFTKYDTTYISKRKDWTNLSLQKKLIEFEKYKNYLKKQTDSLYESNNEAKHFIWVINNSNREIYIPTQDGSPVFILEAQNEDKKWMPIQFWIFSGCGNSYKYEKLKPKKGLRLISKIPEGDYKTKLRYKLLGENKFYYSKEFYGKINYCSFFEKNNDIEKELHYKLEYLPEHWN